MRWESSKTESNHELYRLYRDEKQLLTLNFNPFSNSARVDCEKEKRVFLIRREGFLRNRIVLRNEYGVKIGELGAENRQQFIAINGERIFYTIINNPLAELVLYTPSPDQPLLRCGLEAADGNTGVYFRKDSIQEQLPHPGLLMALCWYMFLPVAKENVPALAAAS